MVRAKVVGIQNLHHQLRKLGKVAEKRGREAAMRAGLLVIENEAKRRVNKVTTSLARSIHSEVKSE